jgi:hypothetical protein
MSTVLTSLLPVLADATALSNSTPVELGLGITLFVAASGLVGQALLGRHRTSELEKGLAHLADELAELRKEQQKDQAACREQFFNLQRQVDQLTPKTTARSGVRKRVDDQ